MDEYEYSNAVHTQTAREIDKERKREGQNGALFGNEPLIKIGERESRKIMVTFDHKLDRSLGIFKSLP